MGSFQMPRYDSPQVQEQLPQGGRLNVQAQPGAFGEVLGVALGNANDMVAKIQENAAQVQAQDAWNQTMPNIQTLTAKMKSIQGGNVVKPDAYGADPGVSFTDAVMKTYKELTQDGGSGLKGQAKVYYDQLAERTRLELHGQATNHEFDQMNAFAVGTVKRGLELEHSNVGQNPTDLQLVSTSIDRIRALSGKLADLLGVTDPDGRKLLQLDEVSHARTEVVKAYLGSDNPTAAFAYFEANKADFNGTDATAIQTHIKAGMTTQLAESKVQAVVSQLGPKDGDLESPFALDKMAKVLREDPALANSPEALHKAMSSLRERAHEHDYSVKQYEDGIQGSLWKDILAGRGLGYVKNTGAYKSLNGEKQVHFLTQVEAFQKRNEKIGENRPEEYLAYFNVINTPGWERMSDDQIRAQTPNLGPNLTIQLMKDINDVRNNPEKLQKAQIDHDILMTSALAGGVISSVKAEGMSSDEKVQLGELASRAKIIMQASGKPWDLENQKKLINSLTAEVVTQRHWYGDDKAKVFQLINQGAVPKSFADAVRAKYRALGQADPGVADLYQLWFDAKAKGLVDENGGLKR